MIGNSREITSNQTKPHPRLLKLLKRHQETSYQAPLTALECREFEACLKKAGSYNGIILDSACGTGESSMLLARENTSCLVIGIDKSSHRLRKGKALLNPAALPNCALLQGNATQLWRFLVKERIFISKHFLLYPNPWPKKKHVQRRWHGHALFPLIPKLGGELTLRSNWEIYMQEFTHTLNILTGAENTYSKIFPQKALSPFERKYLHSKHPLFELKTSFN